MLLLRKITAGLRSLFQKDRDRELDAELQDFLERAAEDKMTQGVGRTDALRAVRLEHGSAQVAMEIVHASRWESSVESCWQDLGFAARLLRKSPGFTAVVVLTLTLGVGANTAIFQLLDAVTMRSLPVNKPEELVEIDIADRTDARGSQQSGHPAVSESIWQEIVRRQDAFTRVFAWGSSHFNLNNTGEARWASGLEVSSSFFGSLGLRPALGRLFMDADDQRGCDPYRTVLSYAFWQSEFAADPAIVGKTLTLEHGPYQIIGVAPANFTGLEVGRSLTSPFPFAPNPRSTPAIAA